MYFFQTLDKSDQAFQIIDIIFTPVSNNRGGITLAAVKTWEIEYILSANAEGCAVLIGLPGVASMKVRSQTGNSMQATAAGH